jgi:hypothetical protein
MLKPQPTSFFFVSYPVRDINYLFRHHWNHTFVPYCVQPNIYVTHFFVRLCVCVFFFLLFSPKKVAPTEEGTSV